MAVEYMITVVAKADPGDYSTPSMCMNDIMRVAEEIVAPYRGHLVKIETKKSEISDSQGPLATTVIVVMKATGTV